jgi:hypothetical protein
MGNYSWLLKVINGDFTIIDWKSILPIINSSENNYFYIDENECSEVVSMTDLSNFLNDRKLFGYLTNGYIKSLCKISLHTKFINDIDNEENIDIIHNIKYPKMYFEEEGWDRIHYLEFHPGTENISWGSYAFDMNENELEKSLVNEYKLIHNIELTQEHDDYEIKIYDEIRKRKKEYMLNLINDKFTNWNIKKLDYSNKVETQNDKLLTFMSLFGIRHEDYLKNPIETTKILHKMLQK